MATDGALDPGHKNLGDPIATLTGIIDGGGDAQAVVDYALGVPTHDNVTALLVRTEAD